MICTLKGVPEASIINGPRTLLRPTAGVESFCLNDSPCGRPEYSLDPGLFSPIPAGIKSRTAVIGYLKRLRFGRIHESPLQARSPAHPKDPEHKVEDDQKPVGDACEPARRFNLNDHRWRNREVRIPVAVRKHVEGAGGRANNWDIARIHVWHKVDDCENGTARLTDLDTFMGPNRSDSQLGGTMLRAEPSPAKKEQETESEPE